MRFSIRAFIVSIAAVSAAPSWADAGLTVDDVLNRYCDRLMQGSPASELADSARASGFTDQTIGGQNVLVHDRLVLGMSDSPRACLVQDPPEMTFAEGVAIVGAWADRNPGAVRGAATTGPDGARVRLWAVPGQRKYLLVSEQRAGGSQMVINFIMAPMPAGS